MLPLLVHESEVDRLETFEWASLHTVLGTSAESAPMDFGHAWPPDGDEQY